MTQYCIKTSRKNRSPEPLTPNICGYGTKAFFSGILYNERAKYI